MGWTRWLALSAMAVLAAAGAVAQQRVALSPPTSAPPASGSLASIPTTTPKPPASLNKSDLDAWLDGYLPYALRTADIPGAVVVIVKDGQILDARGFGYADVAKRIPVDPERTLFRTGSVSKLTTWTAVMQQVEQGKIDLDQDVNTYLDFKIPPREGQPVTMRQLMTHTGGFEETGKKLLFYDAKKQLSLREYLIGSIPNRIDAPGATPAYSNWGTALAGYIVQRTSGEKLEDYFDRHILQPLGMNNTTMRPQLPENLVAQMSIGYPKPGEAPPGFEYLGPWPAGSQSASGTDMGRFMISHLANGRGLMTPATAQLMHNSPLDKVNPFSILPPLNRMELGFFETNVNGHEVIGHLGDTEAFHTSLHLFMQDGVGLYASFNSPGKAGAVQNLRTQLFMDFADRYFPYTGPADGRVDAKTSAEHVQMMVGDYEASRRWKTNYFSMLGLLGQFKVQAGPKGELVIPNLLGPGGRPREWVEIAPFLWRDANGHDRLAAKLVGGKVVRWSMDFFAPFEVMDRVPAGRSSSWILPALSASLIILLLTAIAWPVGWWNRRRFKAAPTLSGIPLWTARASKLAALLTLAVFAGWGTTAWLITSSSNNLTGSLDPLLWLLQIAGAVVFTGAVLLSGWNLRTALRDGSRWTRKLWAGLLLLASLMIFYVAFTFGLIAMTVAY